MGERLEHDSGPRGGRRGRAKSAALVRTSEAGRPRDCPGHHTGLGFSLEAQAGYSMHSGGMLAGWKFSNFKDGVFARILPRQRGRRATSPCCRMQHGPCRRRSCCQRHGAHRLPRRRAGGRSVWRQLSASSASARWASCPWLAAALRGAVAPVCGRFPPKLRRRPPKSYGATDIINYREGDIVRADPAIKTHGKGVDRVIHRRRRQRHLPRRPIRNAQARRMHRQRQLPGQRATTVADPARRMGLRHGAQDRFAGGLMPGGRTAHGEAGLAVVDRPARTPARLLTPPLPGLRAHGGGAAADEGQAARPRSSRSSFFKSFPGGASKLRFEAPPLISLIHPSEQAPTVGADGVFQFQHPFPLLPSGPAKENGRVQLPASRKTPPGC